MKTEKIDFMHRSVLLDECIAALSVQPDGIYVDCTAGGGGHSLAIAEKLSERGLIIAIDQDQEALAAAEEKLSNVVCHTAFFQKNFSQLDKVLDAMGISQVNGVLMDLGVSSYQLDNAERGFAYMKNGKLDMRMNQQAFLTAEEVVNSYSKKELQEIIFKYGEERFAARIADFIIEARNDKRIETTFQLVDIIKKAIPAACRRHGHHPAKKTFQAIRIAVNSELDVLRDALEVASERLQSGGKLAVLTFHSLEDRIVKHYFKERAVSCTCPKSSPICFCGKKQTYKLGKSILPKNEEVEGNPRARSARLRTLTKLAE